MRERMTTWLDVLGLVLIAAGAGAGLWQVLGPAALVVAGTVVLVGSGVAARQARGEGEGGEG